MPARRISAEEIKKRASYKHNRTRVEERLAQEPEPEKSAAMPEGMSLEAERHWPMVAKTLADAGVLTTMDIPALALYCETFAEYREAKDKFTRQPIVYQGRGKTRRPVPSPQYAILDKARAALHRLMNDFGMTPVSRSRVKVDPASKKKKPNRFAALHQQPSGDD